MSSLDSQRWQRVNALLDEALELPRSEREAWLDRIDDAVLRAEVAELLAADDASGDFLEEATTIRSDLLRDAALDLAARRAEARAGQRVGAFRLVREIGRGGMGTVYLGERADGQFEQRVAVKLLERNPHDDRLLPAFLRERQILARLEHPNIARLIDGGMTDDDVPYLVMEYVEGLPITAYCSANALALAERLRIFLAVCAAVEAAHRAQVVHRDLKPSNILVTEGGDVKLLDFGIARRLDLGDATRTIAPAMTPAYAAPEQLRGEVPTPATDVYALGLLLYELLTGRRAQRGDSPDALLRAVLENDPPPPSAAAQRRELRGDLDAITMKAIEKDATRRYASAAALAEDVERYLAGDPITATGGFAYRATKVLRRRRVEAVAAAAVIVVIALALLLARARQARPEQPLHFELFSTFGGSPRQPSLSPDGSKVAYVDADAAGVPQLFMRPVGGGAATQLTHVAVVGARAPRWSPSGAIFYDVPGDGIWSAPASGGAARRIVENGFHASVSRDGKQLLYQHVAHLYLARADGSDAHAVPNVHLHFAFTQAGAALSPDGSQIAYVQDDRSPVNTDLYVASVRGGAPRRLTFDNVETADPAWTPDGSTIYFSSKRAGSLTLWKIAASGGAPRPITSGSGEDTESTISADGRRLLYTNARAEWALSWIDPATGARRTLRDERTVLTHPSFSPDGARIAFFRHRGLRDEIFTMAADGSDERRLTTPADGNNVLPDYSLDGSTIYFYRLAPDPAFVGVPAGGGAIRTLLPAFPLSEHVGAHVDPAGRRVVYPIMNADSVSATVVHDVAGGAERRLATPIVWPRWSPDGKSIAGTAAGGRLTLCPDDGGAYRTLSPRGGDPRWSAGWIYFARYSQAFGESDIKPIEIRRVRPDSSGEQLVTTLPGADPVNFFFDVSPRGDIVWCQLQSSPSELWMTTLR